MELGRLLKVIIDQKTMHAVLTSCNNEAETSMRTTHKLYPPIPGWNQAVPHKNNLQNVGSVILSQRNCCDKGAIVHAAEVSMHNDPVPRRVSSLDSKIASSLG